MTGSSILAANLEPEAARTFDSFIAASPFAAYQQTRAWASIAPRRAGQSYLFFLAQDAAGPIGAAVIRRTRLAPGAWLATLQRGPVVAEAGDLARILPDLMIALRNAGCCSIQLAPRIRGRAMPIMTEAMRSHGFAPLAGSRQPLHVATGIVWLDKPEDAIFAGFKQRGRRQIRAGEKAGIVIRTATTADDIAAYQKVLDGFRAVHPGYDMSGLPNAAGQAALIDRLGGAMLIAERAGAVIAGHAFVRQADEAIWLSLATAPDYSGAAPSYPLLWQAMRTARDMGCIGYDLAGIPIDEPGDTGEANRLQFKAAFAPTRRIMPPMQIAALRPIRHMMFFNARQFYRHSALRRRIGAIRHGDGMSDARARP